MKQSALLFGASKLGEVAFNLLKDQFNFIGFIDNNEKKWNTIFNGLTVYSPEKLHLLPESKIIISSQYSKEISLQLTNLGFHDYFIFNWQLQSPDSSNSLRRRLEIPIINLGHFLASLNAPQYLETLTLLWGGSGILDYLLLKALVLKFDIKTYLEIGSWSGESLSCVSALVSNCYSISLPDEKVEGTFRSHWGKNNFSKYFSKNLPNVTYFNEDSKLFNYNKIENKIDLVFIDGDHTYQGIYIDTKRIFEVIDCENTIVVWHDFKVKRDEAISTTVDAVFNAIPHSLSKNIFAVDANMCGIFIPDKYLHFFDFEDRQDEVYSYNVSLYPTRNNLKR